MAKPNQPAAKKPVEVVLNDPAHRKGELRNVGGSRSDKWNLRLANQVIQSAWLGHSDEAQKLTDIEALTIALTGIKPQNEVEGMLAAQLIAAHNAAMEAYRRAMLPEQTFEGRDQSLTHAVRLSKAFAGLVDTLHRVRGNAQQKVVVEHVHVHPGGQAVVGLVNGRGGGATPQIEEQPYAQQLADAREPALRGQDESRDSLPIPRNAERPLPDARRPSPGAPRGNRNALKHGRYTAEALAARREMNELLRALRTLNVEVREKI